MTHPADRKGDSADSKPDSTHLREMEELAWLARLRPAEPLAIATQIDRLLGHFTVLREIDTEGVEPSAYPIAIEHRSRPDEPEEALPPAEVLRNAPAQRGDCFLVPRVIEG